MQLRRAASCWLFVPLMFGLLVMPHAGHDGPTVDNKTFARHFVGMSQAVAHETATHGGQPAPARPPSGSGAIVTAPPDSGTAPHVAFALSCLIVLFAGFAYLAMRGAGSLTRRRTIPPPPSRGATRPAGRDPPVRFPTLLCVVRT